MNDPGRMLDRRAALDDIERAIDRALERDDVDLDTVRETVDEYLDDVEQEAGA
jgi:hypothetical protein